ncbi:MAG TPA: T9SS type A sorting domain-containing protein [Cytophagales bacterium]|nr:T9SS type A sorting domain-containing protein [Cytophagales bacterium]
MRNPVLVVFSIFITFQGFSQNLFFTFDNTVKVEQNGKILTSPWVGGLNAAHISKIDLNNDQVEDLLLFDKITGRVTTFVAVQESGSSFFKHEPKYEFLFPVFKGYVLSVDYNCDGKKDIFTAGNTGDVMVYKNISEPAGNIKFEIAKETILTEGLSGLLSLHISQTDVPSITDLDEDGDLDIVTFDASGGHSAILHKNQSQEKYGHCDSLDFKRIGTCWGNFMKGHSCSEVEFGVDCGNNEAMRVLHTGSTSLVLDLDGDTVKDLLIGGVSCNNLLALKNAGTSLNANFTSVTDTFPLPQLFNFPASFYEDVDFDGLKDLIVSPNISSNQENLANLDRSIMFFKNSGLNEAPVFDLISSDFLQNEMIDLGEYSYPALADIDGDNDMDLLVGHRGKLQADNSFYATLYLYENIGSVDVPSFKLKSTDYLNLSSLKYQNVKPYVIDLDEDGRIDFVFAYTDPDTNKGSLAYILNPADGGFDLDINAVVPIDFSFNSYDNPLLYDVDKDGLLDLILGSNQGRLEYYKNSGTNLAPSFTLTNDKFGGIENSLSNLSPSPFIYNLDHTGTEELIIGDRSGKLKFFFDWQKELDGVFTNSPDFLLNEFSEKFESVFFGKEIFPTAGDLNNDGLPELILGTNGGGLIYLKNETAVNGSENEIGKSKLRIYPNPSNNTFLIESETGGVVEVFSLLGQRVFSKSIEEGKANIDLNKYEKGTYIVRMTSSAGKTYSVRISKE